MSYLDQLRESRGNAVAAYQDFVLHTSKFKDGLFCFFEGVRGSDHAYYVPRIKQVTQNYHPIKCGGRDKVLKVHQLILTHLEYDKYKKAFFIDRDFNESLEPFNPPIFETPCYSIENLYVSIAVFKEIIKNAFSLSEMSEAYQVCVTLFEERQNEFQQATILFNAWYACLIENRNMTGQLTGLNLDDKLPKGFVDITLESVSAKYDLEEIRRAFPNALEVPNYKLEEKIQTFSNCEHHKVFRGKYELQFVLIMLEMILQDSTRSKKYFKERVRFAFGEKLSNDQAIALFSNYAETPTCLMDYLKNVTQSTV